MTQVAAQIFRTGRQTRIEIPIGEGLKGLTVRMCNETGRILVEGTNETTLAHRPSLPPYHLEERAQTINVF